MFPDPKPVFWPIVCALGITQIIGYGTLYYSFSLLAPAIATSLDVTPTLLFAVFSAGLILSGFASPLAGRLLDRVGAPKMMAVGSLAAATSLTLAASAPNAIIIAAAIIAIELLSALILYDAAFTTLTRLTGPHARRSITNLTLIAGFASTIFWPLTGWGLTHLGWRGVYIAFAGLHLFIALPLHLWLTTRTPVASTQTNPDKPAHAAAPVLDSGRQRFAFLSIAVSFALSNVLISALGLNLVPILQSLGLGTSAFLVSMLMGPSQVAVRLTDALFWRGFHPIMTAILSAGALPVAVLILMSGLPGLLAGAIFAILFGIGQGLSSIVRGTLPLALFGAEGFGTRLGQLASIRIFLSAGAPFLFSALQQSLGIFSTLALMLVIGIIAVLPLLWLKTGVVGRVRV